MIIKLLIAYLTTFGEYLILMGHTFRRSERMRMFFKRCVKEMCQLGVDSMPLALLISPLIGAVICIQTKANVQSPWMSRRAMGYITCEAFLSEFAGAFACLVLTGKVGSNIASELDTMRVTQQIDALDIMGVNPASYPILPKIAGLIIIMLFLAIFSSVAGIIGAYGTAYSGALLLDDLTAGFQYSSNVWFVRMSIIKSIIFAFVIASVSSFYGYSVRGGSVEVGEASTNAAVDSSVSVPFAGVSLIPLLSWAL